MRPQRYAVALLALLFPVAQADFKAALTEYREGHYEAAHAQFLALAELGDPASQFNLGAMALSGKGAPRDMAIAVGWFTAAADNGNRDLGADKLAGMKSKLTDEERKTADGIATHYGREGLHATVLPVPSYAAYCRGLIPAKMRISAEGMYPRSGRFADQDGFAIVQLSISVDGVARDPEVLMVVPNGDFSAAAVELLMQSRYLPATREGQAVESRLAVKVKFTMDKGGILWDSQALKAIREQARLGEPSAQYVVGLAATLDPSLGLSADKAQELLVAAAQGGYPHAQYWAANRFMSVGSCEAEKKKLPWLRAAAAAGDGAAQLALALELLKGEPSAEQLAEAKSLIELAAKSDDFYVMKHVTALLASSSVDAIRDPTVAAVVARKLERNPIDADPQMFEALALAYAANKDFWAAASKEQVAIKKAGALHWNTQLMQQRYEAYHHSQPWAGDVFSVPAAAGSAAR